MSNTFLSQLDWRFATKKFDPDKKVSQEDLDKVLNAIRMAPTSKGVQPWQVIVVSDKELKNRLKPVSQNQAQVVDCQYLLVFCLRLDIDKRARDYVSQLEQADPAVKNRHEQLSKNMQEFAQRKKAQGLEAWAARQTYLALGFGLAACAELSIDSCPMEGFQSAEVDKVLELPDHLKSLAYLAIGYRQEEPKHPKIRYPDSDLFSWK
ncbi:MAG: NAD(P)H-dependent oxidoreductase [bacterium]